jgi:hypothetical protein
MDLNGNIINNKKNRKMATTNFLWVISQLNCAVESEGLPNVINVIHWRYQATQVDGDKTWFAETYGASSVAQPNPQNFVPYEDVTEAEVISWLEEILPVDAMQASLEANIALQITPTEVTLPLPWAPAPVPPTLIVEEPVLTENNVQVL